ncbi:aspartyl protease family protein [Francisella philomiragia]|uniref:Aspartyl protease family protein n=1 Tax=Francisella philomiragia TaxID=28110 RepID=A0AAW3DDS4_9GAMM|nr:aspartyl protease family protein [Francisella philomiragia]KFJ43733.1 aspartyl protease family protein [Francisella philomiragia]MBK2255252.1 aspartyl protease family protein [Francisella philomiragia]MBK2273580.1 aspartyl protease family protein [Francisella philomiragia]MBK2277248.1 aspartyl protease family protein [Francisella philomiragia]MBK2281167.1 aspartyl protease family protein [Francisella philomiragia]
MFRKILIIFSFCLFMNLSVANNLQDILKEYAYEALKLENKKEFKAPYVLAKVNNRFAYVIFDSGSKGISVFSHSVDQLGLNQESGSGYSSNMVGQKIKNQNVVLNKIQIGDILLKNVEAKITNQPKRKQYPVIVVGTDFLVRYNAIFDFSESLIYLNKNNVTAKKHYEIEQVLDKENYLLISLTKLLSQHQTIAISIDSNKPVNCLLDTGTSNFTISDKYLKSIDLAPTKPHKTIKATDGTLTVADIKIKNLILNPMNLFFQNKIQLVNLDATAANIESMSKFLGVVCILGYDELHTKKAIYDLVAGRIYIKVKK